MISRNVPFIAIGVIGIGAGVLGYWLSQQQHRPGVDISIGTRGVTIQER
jgi:hypothetical protein